MTDHPPREAAGEQPGGAPAPHSPPENDSTPRYKPEGESSSPKDAYLVEDHCSPTADPNTSAVIRGDRDDQAHAFLRAVHGSMPDGSVLMLSGSAAGQQGWRAEKTVYGPDRLEACAAAAVALGKNDRNVYVSVNPLDAVAVTELRAADRHARGSAAHVAAVTSLVVDADHDAGTHKAVSRDGKPLPPSSELDGIRAKLTIQPTVVVNSGGGEQWYVPVEPLDPADPRTTDILRRWKQHVIDCFGEYRVDEGVLADTARVLRVPGTYNTKDPAAKRPCRLVSIDETSSPLTFAELDAALPPLAAKKSRTATAKKPSRTPTASSFSGGEAPEPSTPDIDPVYDAWNKVVSSSDVLDAMGWVLISGEVGIGGESQWDLPDAEEEKCRIQVHADGAVSVYGEWTAEVLGQPIMTSRPCSHLVGTWFCESDWRLARRLLHAAQCDAKRLVAMVTAAREQAAQDGEERGFKSILEAVIAQQGDAGPMPPAPHRPGTHRLDDLPGITVVDDPADPNYGVCKTDWIPVLDEDGNELKTRTGRVVKEPILVPFFRAVPRITGEIQSFVGDREIEEPRYDLEVTARAWSKTLRDLTLRDVQDLAYVRGMCGHDLVLPASTLDRRHLVEVFFSFRETERRRIRLRRHLGWTKHAGTTVFAAPAGSIGANGPIAGVEVGSAPGSDDTSCPVALRTIGWPRTADGDELRQAIRSIGDLIGIHRRPEVGVALIGGVFSGPLGLTQRPAVIAVGEGQRGKSAEFSRLHAYVSTRADRGAAPVRMQDATVAGVDAVVGWFGPLTCWLDDFKPATEDRKNEVMIAVFEGAVRGAYEDATASKSTQKGGMRQTNLPQRCGVVVTAERASLVHTTVERGVELGFERGDIDTSGSRGPLDVWREKFIDTGAANALFGSFVAWCAGRIDATPGGVAAWQQGNDRLRLDCFATLLNGRAGETVAPIAVGWEMLRRFATEHGVADELPTETEIEASLRTLVASNVVVHGEASAATMLADVIADHLRSGRWHVTACEDGGVPTAVVRSACGWRQSTVWPDQWEPRGTRAGWLRDGGRSELHLLPGEVRAMCASHPSLRALSAQQLVGALASCAIPGVEVSQRPAAGASGQKASRRYIVDAAKFSLVTDGGTATGDDDEGDDASLATVVPMASRRHREAITEQSRWSDEDF